MGKLLLLLGPCSHSGIFLAQCPRGNPNLLTYSNWLLLAAPTHRVLLSNKGTWNHRNWVRPSRQIGQARPVKTVCRSLGARGPSASCHPILTWWLTQVGAYDHEGPSKVLGWGEQAQVHHQHQIFDLHPTVQSAQNRSSSSSPFVSSSAFPFLPLASESIL